MLLHALNLEQMYLEKIGWTDDDLTEIYQKLTRLIRNDTEVTMIMNLSAVDAYTIRGHLTNIVFNLTDDPAENIKNIWHIVNKTERVGRSFNNSNLTGLMHLWFVIAKEQRAESVAAEVQIATLNIKIKGLERKVKSVPGYPIG